MAVPFHSKLVRIEGLDLVAEAMMNNCSNLWTATVSSPQRLVATGAGTTPEAAMAAAIERAMAALAAPQAAAAG
jgi:hypothetical protein